MDDAIQFFDETAHFYDAFYGHRELDDVPFYIERAESAGGPVLEVACGTGRVYLELLDAGVDADGFDGSAEMLSILREQASQRGLDPSVWQADMRTVEADREYGLIIVPFRAFLHLIETADQQAALERFHELLAPGGELIIAFFAPDFEVICGDYGEWRVVDIEVEGTEYTVRDRSEFADEIEQTVRVDREIRDPEGDVVAESRFTIKMIPKREFELLLETSPFEDWSVHGDFELDSLERTSQEMVWIVES